MSTLTYNNITIGLTRTLGIMHEPIRGDDETYLFTRVTIDVEGIVNGPPNPSQNGSDLGSIDGTIGNPISDTMRAIRHQLLQERRLLVYNVGDSPTPMIVAPGFDADGNLYPCDANNGPTPGNLVINRVDGVKTFHVRFRVSCHLLECPGLTSGPPSALLSNRYAQTHSIDSNWFTTVSTSGQAFFRTDILEASQQVADHYRDVLLPPIPKGMKRMSITIVATPSRNALTYQCIDVERSFDLGDTGPTGSNSNITDVQANYSVGSTGQAGAPVMLNTAHSMPVMVMGSKAASTWTLVKAAFTILQAKLPISDPSRGFLSQISINANLTGRSITLQATMILSPQNVNMIPGIDVGALREDNTFAPQGGLNPAPPSRGGTAGTYQNEALTSAWKSACEGPRKPYEGGVATANDDPDSSANTGPIVTTTITDDLPTFSPGYSYEQVRFPFTEYHIDSVIETNTGVMQVPIAGKLKSSDSSSTSTYSLSDQSGTDSADDDQPDSEIITLGRPTQRKVIEWTAERVGASPIVPPAQPSDPNLVLIDSGYIQVTEPSLLADGVSLSYRVKGRYIYALKKNLKSTDSLPYPAPPWQAHVYGELALEQSDFQDGIIDGSTSSSSYGRTV